MKLNSFVHITKINLLAVSWYLLKANMILYGHGGHVHMSLLNISDKVTIWY